MAVASLSHLWIWLLAPAVPRSLPSPWPALVALVGRAPNPRIQAQLQTLVDVEVLEPPRPKSLVSAAEVEAIRSQLPWRWVEETGAAEVEAARRQLPLRVLAMAQRRLHPLQVSRVLAVAQESRGAMDAARRHRWQLVRAAEEGAARPRTRSAAEARSAAAELEAHFRCT